MSAFLARAQVLIAQSRFGLAETELRNELAQRPENADGHALLALCLAEQGRHKDATWEAKEAIHLAPDNSYCHHVLGKTCCDQGRYHEALQAAEEAIRLAPEDAESFALLAIIYWNLERWHAALDTAQEGLRVDPEHVGCANLRGMALVKLGRYQEARNAIRAALGTDPVNALTHCNQGWTFLELGEHPKALESFREALRIDPRMEWAHQGILQALKSRNFMYRLMLRVMFRIARWDETQRTGFGIVAMLLLQAVFRAPDTDAQLLGSVQVLLWILLAFFILLLIADPLGNLMLRFDYVGRLALSEGQLKAANWTGVSLTIGLLALLAAMATGRLMFLFVSVGSAGMSFPVSVLFQCEGQRTCRVVRAAISLLVLVGLAAVGWSLLEVTGAPLLGTIFFLGLLLFPCLARPTTFRV